MPMSSHSFFERRITSNIPRISGPRSGVSFAHYTEVQHRLEVILAKNRAGPTKTIPLFCDVASSHVANFAREVR